MNPRLISSKENYKKIIKQISKKEVKKILAFKKKKKSSQLRQTY
jgi:hypothetical protein